MKVTNLHSTGTGGENHYSPDYKRSVFYFGPWITIQRVERKFKPTKYRYYCQDTAEKRVVDKIQERWDDLLEMSVEQNNEYLIKHVHEACFAYSEEFDTYEDAVARGGAHADVFHPFSSGPLCRKYDLTPAWVYGSVLPRRKDIHHHDSNSRADADPGSPGQR